MMGGRLDVEDAVDLLQAGARDYVAMDRLSRLGPAVLAALKWEERRRAQGQAARAMRVSEIRYRRLFESARDGILILDADKGKILDVNPFMENLLGYTRSEFLGKTLWEIGAFKDIAENISAFAELQDREYLRYENLPLETKDGRVVEVEFVSNVYPENDQKKVIQCNIRDITERKLMEKLLFQSRKMEAFGILAGGMAHSINNTLGVIVGNLDIVRPMLPAGGDADELIGGALDAAVSGGELTRQLLDFARNQPLQRERVDVNRLIAGTAKLLRSTIGSDIVLSLDLQSDAWPISADPAQLEASLVNLANNARQAMPRGGRLKITTRNCDLDADFVAAHADVTPGEYVAIAVTDDGSGISPAISARIFEPFFTTKEEGKGTGLGLSMVFAFVKQSHGHVEFASEEGAGTTFRIYLPRADEAVLAQARPISSSPSRGSGELVLVVEDNTAMREIALRQLRDLGYRVAEADCAAAALDVLATEKVDLLFTDVTMPGGMTGLELARIANERTPSLKVVVTTGYSATDIGATDMLLLSKPFRKDDLARAIRAALDARSNKVAGESPVNIA
jgi:PAS domain S-box-containing protein